MVAAFIVDVAGNGSSAKCSGFRMRGDLGEVLRRLHGKGKGQWVGPKFGGDDCCGDIRA